MGFPEANPNNPYICYRSSIRSTKAEATRSLSKRLQEMSITCIELYCEVTLMEVIIQFIHFIWFLWLNELYMILIFNYLDWI